MTKVMRKEARHTQRRDRASGVPLEILEHIPPKPESAYFLLVLSPKPLTLRGALPHYLPKYWSFSFNISPSNEHSGLISFKIDWFDLLAVQGTLKRLLQHHSLKASNPNHWTIRELPRLCFNQSACLCTAEKS